MSFRIGSADADDDVVAAINTTPLVDVMLVLLIIFLITIPVVVQTVSVRLPKETNAPTQTRPDNVVVAVDREGAIYWNRTRVAESELLDNLKVAAVRQPQPEVHIRGDEDAPYKFVGKVVAACQRAGIGKVGFITEPPARGD